MISDEMRVSGVMGLRADLFLPSLFNRFSTTKCFVFWAPFFHGFRAIDQIIPKFPMAVFYVSTAFRHFQSVIGSKRGAVQ